MLPSPVRNFVRSRAEETDQGRGLRKPIAMRMLSISRAGSKRPVLLFHTLIVD